VVDVDLVHPSARKEEMISNAIAIANSKGGVGKSSVAVNLAGLAAHSGWRTLLVDLDPQGQVGYELGVGGTDLDDKGRGLLLALLEGAPLEPVKDVRPGLDIVTAGAMTENVADQLRRTDVADVERVIAPMSANYDLIVFDTPPATGSPLADAALVATHFVVIPTKSDGGSLRGLQDMATRCSDIRARSNPDLSVLGVVIFAVKASASRRRQDRRDMLEAGLPAEVIVFDSFIREAAAAGDDLRDLALLAHEYEAQAVGAPKWWERRRDPTASKAPTFASNAADLASDYQKLTEEVLAAYRSRLEVAA